MAQIKNNQVRGTMRTTTPQMRGTVDMQSAMRGMSGATPFNMSMNPGGQSKIPAPAPLVKFTPTSIQALNSPRTTPTSSMVPGTNNYTPMGIQALGGAQIPSVQGNSQGGNQPNISPSFPQTGQTAGPATNSTQNSINSISAGAQSVQDLLDKKTRADNFNNQRNESQNDTSFKGILDTLLGRSNPQAEQERTRKEMERISAGNKAIADEAKRTSDMYGKEIARVGGLGAGAVAGNLSTGTNVVGSGNAAIASQSASTRMDALAKAQQAALEGTAQQLTGQEQAAQAFRPSLDATLTQQQQGITGLSNAANYAQPTQVPYSNQFIDPITGQSAGGAGLGGYSGFKSMEQAFDIAGQYPDAGFQYDPNLTPQQNLQNMQMAQQGSPTYQKNTYGVPGQGSFADATVQQTAQKGYQDAYQAYQDIAKQKTYADNISSQLSGVMSQYGIGENDVRKVNEIQNFLGRQFGEEGQIAFQTALTEAQRAYSTLLTIGGGTVPTEATAASNAILNPNSTIAQINAAIKQLKAAGDERLRTQGTQADTYYQQLQAGSQQGGGGTGGNVFAETW